MKMYLRKCEWKLRVMKKLVDELLVACKSRQGRKEERKKDHDDSAKE